MQRYDCASAASGASSSAAVVNRIFAFISHPPRERRILIQRAVAAAVDRPVPDKIRAPAMLFADKSFIADMTAKMMLEVKAVHFSEGKPFVFTSGWASPVYIDCRKLISFPRVRSTLIDFATATIVRDVGFEQFDTVAGGETAGIPYAAWIADRLSLPMQYVRKKPKGFGRGAQIEGHIEEGAGTPLVEGPTTGGRSKGNF